MTTGRKPTSLARSVRRLDRRVTGVASVLAALRGGACLQLNLSPRPHWRLNTGLFVSDEIARAVISRPDVAGCGDALFGNATAQTFRFIKRRTKND